MRVEEGNHKSGSKFEWTLILGMEFDWTVGASPRKLECFIHKLADSTADVARNMYLKPIL
jgi:hypothetical protein